jgi:hypothetical protein
MVRKAMTGNLQPFLKNAEDQLTINGTQKDGLVARQMPQPPPTSAKSEFEGNIAIPNDIEKSRNYAKFEEMVDSELNELLTLSDKPFSKSESNLYQEVNKNNGSDKTKETKPETKTRFTIMAKDSGVLELMEISGAPPVPKNPNIPWKLQTSKSEGALAHQERTEKSLPELPRKLVLSPVIKRRLNQLFPRENNPKKPINVDNFVPASPLRNVVSKESPVKDSMSLKGNEIPIIDITTPSKFEASLEEVESPLVSAMQANSPQSPEGTRI